MLIEDDPDDVEIITAAIDLLQIDSELVVFRGPNGVREYLTDPLVMPMLVISDVNLPITHGIDIYIDLQAHAGFAAKRIPYVFLSTSPQYSARASEVNECGYFVKPRDYFDYVSIIQRIVLYWRAVA